jgi:PilZ domain
MTVPRIANRSRRFELMLPVTVTGVDVSGRAFSEATRTLNVSGGGLAFETRRRLEIGSRLLLDIKLPPRLRRPFRGRPRYRVVAVVCRLFATPGGPDRIGVRFIGEP